MMEIRYEFPHDTIHHLRMKEMAPHSYVAEIMGVPVIVESTPSENAWSVKIPKLDWEAANSSVARLLENAHEGIAEYLRAEAASHVVYKIGDVDREFIPDPKCLYVRRWVHVDGDTRLMLDQDDTGFRAWMANPARRTSRSIDAYGETAELALNALMLTAITDIHDHLAEVERLRAFLAGSTK